MFDETGMDSGWVMASGSYRVGGHPAPYPEFVFRTRSSDPNPGKFVYFGDRSICYSNDGPYSCGSTNPTTGEPNGYTWTFGDNSEPSYTVGYAVHTYSAANTTPGYLVNLNVCDETTCCSIEHLVPVGGNSLPNWKEISPF